MDSIIVSNPVQLDINVYKSWLKGHTIDQTTSMHSVNERFAKFLESNMSDSQRDRIPSALKLLQNQIANQFRLFESVEHYLHRPKNFIDQFLIPLPPDIKRFLVERYYCFDESVIRELLGKRLNARSRKDLDEVSEKTKVSLASCRRQFDNLKRIYKRVEDVDGDLIGTIMKKFLLPHGLACSYAHILFITENRLDTTKKKLSNMLFSDFEYCASIFMNYWTFSIHHEDIDDVLAQDLRDLRSVMLNDKSLMENYIKILTDNRNQVMRIVAKPLGKQTTNSPTISGESSYSTATLSVETFSLIFRLLLRTILQIGATLSQSKEFREIFTLLTDKLVEPLLANNISTESFEAFMDHLNGSFVKLGNFRAPFRDRYKGSWARLIEALKLLVLRLFNTTSLNRRFSYSNFTLMRNATA